MVTLKQLEALAAIVRLGSFARAADKLGATQSAISKRIRELEAAARLQVFDRSHREARLTPHGEDLLAIGLQMLELRERAMGLPSAGVVAHPRLRLGVTELTALTWLPDLIARIRSLYPHTILEPVVDMSRSLYERLYDDVVDIVIIPDAFSDPHITAVPLGLIENAWMASPSLLARAGDASLARLGEHTFLTQGGKSGSSILVGKWMKAAGIDMPNTLVCDSLVAQLGLTVAGIGVSCLPRACFSPLVRSGQLAEIGWLAEPPVVPYAAMYRGDRPSGFVARIARLAAELCDFSRAFAAPRPAGAAP
jgi:DNA-binding transcriptional LysR family regulator